MKTIIITEQQLNKLIESKDYYDFWDISYIHNTLEEFERDKNNGRTQKKWDLIPFEQYRNALIEFMKYGEFMRFPTRYVNKWSNIITNNTLAIKAGTELAGHVRLFPYDDFCNYFDFTKDSDEYHEFYGNFEECYKYLDKLGFYDWCVLPDGSDAISDYGLEPLLTLLMELEEKESPEEKIVVINKILDVYHQRGDLSSAFIQGGSKSLWQISRPGDVNENKKYTLIKESGSVNFTNSVNEKGLNSYYFSVRGVDMVAEIYPNPWSKNSYDVSFGKADGAKDLKYRIGKDITFLNTVLHTVFECIKDFINKTNNVKLIAFEAEPIREKVYVRFIKNHPYFSKFELRKSGMWNEIIINKYDGKINE